MIAISAAFTRSSRVLDAVVVCAGLVSGLLTPQIMNFIDGQNYPRGFAGANGVFYAVSAVPFAMLVLAMARIVAGASWWRAIAFGFATLVAMSLAVTLSANTNVALGDWPEPGRDLVAGPVGGLIGSGLMVLAAVALPVGPRQAARWLPLLAVGTILGALLAVDAWRDSDSVWVIFPVWQASIAFVLLRTLQSSHAAGAAS